MSIELKYGPALAGKQHRIIHTSSTDDHVLVTGNLDPSIDLGFDIGEPSLRWREVYVETIDITGNIVHKGDNINLSANGTIDHTTVSITGGEGLTGGGDISVSRVIDLDLDGLASEAIPDGATDYVAIYDASVGSHRKVLLNNLPSSGGETNTASNQGAAGVGVFKQKTVFDLEFKNINAGSSKITIVDDIANNEIDIDVSEANVDHDSLLNYVTNEHINHTSVILTAGVGLTGGGDISASRTFDLDIHGLTEDLTPDIDTDYVATYDTSAGSHKKVLLNELGEFVVGQNVNATGIGVYRTKVDETLQFRGIVAGSLRIDVALVGNVIRIDADESEIRHDFLNGWTVNDHISHADVHIIAGNGLSGGGDIITDVNIELDIDELTANVSPDGAADYVVVYDTSDMEHKKVLINNLPSAGGGETNSASNEGVGGVGVFIQKTGVNLEFKNINTNEGLVVTNDTGNNEIDIDLSISTLPEDFNPNVDMDYIVTYDTSEGTHKKVLLGNVLTGSTGVFGNPFEDISDETETSTTSVAPTYTQKIRLTTSTLTSGDYYIVWYYEWRYTNTNNDFVARVQINDTTTIMEHQQEPKDSGSNQSYPASGWKVETLSGINNIDLDFARSTTSGIAYIKRARLAVWRIS